MRDECDVLVLGGGVAGVAAALAAAHSGARVIVARAAPGTTALSLGGWRGLLPVPMRTALENAGLPLLDTDGPLPRPDGTLLDAALAPLSHVRASITAAARSGRTIVCGIDGLGDFSSRALAALWTAAAGMAHDVLAAATITIDGTPPGGWSPTSLAALLEREPQRLAVPLAAAAAVHDAAHVILPAVLGLEGHARLHAELERATSLSIGEALGARPSLPGWRVDVALRSALDNAAIPLHNARVAAHDREGKRVTGVTLSGDVNARTIRASCCVLATGKFVGGGIRAESGFADSALGCDVALHRFDRIFRDASDALLLTAELRTDPQPLLSVGIRCDADARPLDVTGDVIFENVFVAGSVRADVDTAALGLGDAAADGWSAGERAASFARRS